MNPNLQIAKEGNDPAGAAQRLGDLIDRVMDKCPDATVLVAMIISTCNEAQQVNTARYQALIPDIVRSRQSAGKHVIAVDFSTFPTSSLRDCIHPTNQGYRDFADYWYDFITQIPTDWIEAPNGNGPDRPTHPGLGANGGLDSGISPPNWGSNPIQVGSKAGIREAANKASNGGLRVCKGGPVWQGTGKIALGAGNNGDWKFDKHWEEVGRVADGLGRDPDHVR